MAAGWVDPRFFGSFPAIISQNKLKNPGWKSAIQGLEGRIANQEDEHKKERDKILRQAQALKKALDAEKNKSFFQKLFG